MDTDHDHFTEFPKHQCSKLRKKWGSALWLAPLPWTWKDNKLSISHKMAPEKILASCEEPGRSQHVAEKDYLCADFFKGDRELQCCVFCFGTYVFTFSLLRGCEIHDWPRCSFAPTTIAGCPVTRFEMAEGSWRVCLVVGTFDFCRLVFLFVLLYFGGVISLQVQKPSTKSSKSWSPKIWGISLSNSDASLRHQRSSVDGWILAQDPLGVATPPGSAGQVFQLSSWIVFPTEGDPSVVVVMGPQTGMPAHGFGKNGSVGQGI